ncbi:MAG: Retron-type RNA-directed polymerase [Verrucomicrobiales bacterium]|nr:Retron-type RNA-directed polymerase [Verrucomicrobiales bacterium]
MPVKRRNYQKKRFSQAFRGVVYLKSSRGLVKAAMTDHRLDLHPLCGRSDFSANGETASRCGGLLQSLRRLCTEEGIHGQREENPRAAGQFKAVRHWIVVNQRPNVPRTLRRRLRAILHQARTTGLAAQNTGNHPNFPMWLRGMIAWVSSTNPDEGRRLLEAFKALK